MKLSAKTEYACLAVLELACRYDRGEPAPIRAIADAQGIPSQFLVQILLQLKAAGIVISTRGASGGYQLARPPEEISLFEVKSVVEGTSDIVSNLTQPTPHSQALLDAWRAAVDLGCRELEGSTFADLKERTALEQGVMYYI